MRQENFGSFSTDRISLRECLRHEDARDILGATCMVLEDKTKIWHVKMPEFIEVRDRGPILEDSIYSRMLEEDESDLNEYLDDPIDPVLCVPEQDHDRYWDILRSQFESRFGGPGIHPELLAVIRTFGEANIGCQDALNSSFLVHA